MGTLIRLAALAGLAALIAAPPVKAEPLDRFGPHIAEASQRSGVPVDWIERVIRAESRGRTTLDGRPITSSAGAMGLMQLMPGTWAEMRARFGLGRDPHEPRDNILAGTFYLRWLYDRFGYPGLFAAYNAGPARYADHLAGRSRLPAETRAYLAVVAGADGNLRPAATRVPVAPPPLFFVRTATAEQALPAPRDPLHTTSNSPLFLIVPRR
jgi:soluble lytic murein transglycosylase-like protein